MIYEYLRTERTEWTRTRLYERLLLERLLGRVNNYWLSWLLGSPTVVKIREL